MITCSPDYITALKSPIKVAYIKMEIYDSNMAFLSEITKQVTKDDIGKISLAIDRAIRRSFSFGLNNTDGTFTFGEDRLVWLDKRVKLYTGLKLKDGTIEYIPQGVFVVSDPSDTHSLDKGKRVYISGQDKMYLYCDKRGAFVNQLTIAKNTPISTAIKTIMTVNGNETMFNFDEIDTIVPYEITFSPTDTIYTAIKQLADLAICDIYYDVNGYLRLRKLDLNDFNNYPSVWTFNYGDPTEKFYAGNVRKLDETQLANHIRVLGGSSQTATVIYDLVVDETQPLTIEKTNNDTFFYGTFSSTIASDGIGLSLSQNGTSFNEKLTTQADFQTGTLTNVIATSDGYLSLPTEEAIRFTGQLVSSVTNAYYYQDIYTKGIAISTGDKLVYDVYLTGSQYTSAIDGYIPGIGSLRSIAPALVDQNGLSVDPKTNLSGKADNKWYHREFDLSSLDGKVLASVQVVLEGNSSGIYNSYFKNIYIKDVNNNVKRQIFLNSLDVTTVSPSSNGGCTTDYTSMDLTTVNVASQLTGNRISPIINLGTVTKYGNSTITWDEEALTDTTVKVETQLSTNGGTTWGSWTTITSGSSLAGIAVGADLTNYRLQMRQTLTTTDITSVPTIQNFETNVNAQYVTTGTFTSDPFQITTIQTAATGTTSIIIDQDVPYNTSMDIQLSVSLDNGNTWSSYYSIYDGMAISQITNAITDLSQVKLKYTVSMTSDSSISPTIKSITFGTDTNLWKDNPYSIQKLGRILYQHNGGSPDSLITNHIDAVNRSRFELMKRLGFTEQVSLSISPITLLEVNDFITVEDAENNVSGKYRIESMDIPLVPDLMTIQCTKFRQVIADWNAI